jgi:Domain of unknown function (DUF4331)
MNRLSKHLLVLPVLAAALSGCGSGGAGTQLVSVVPQTPTTTTWVQVDRLARPGINEGLILSNDNLNAYNSVPPSVDLTAAASGVVAEAAASLNLLNGNDAAHTAGTAHAFLPDVMRIDTTAPSGYAQGASFTGAAFATPLATMLTGGRLILDPVIAITLTVLTKGGITTDNVTYDANNVSGNPGTGHQPLTPTFPFLAPPN